MMSVITRNKRVCHFKSIRRVGFDKITPTVYLTFSVFLRERFDEKGVKALLSNKNLLQNLLVFFFMLSNIIIAVCGVKYMKDLCVCMPLFVLSREMWIEGPGFQVGGLRVESLGNPWCFPSRSLCLINGPCRMTPFPQCSPPRLHSLIQNKLWHLDTPEQSHFNFSLTVVEFLLLFFVTVNPTEDL